MLLLKNCFCCTLRTASLIVAWLETVVSGMCLLYCGIEAVRPNRLSSIGVPLDQPMGLAAASVFVLTFGLLLLAGIYQNIPRCVYVYVIQSAVVMVFLIVRAVIHIVSVYINYHITLGFVIGVCGTLLFTEALLLLKASAVHSLYQDMKFAVKASSEEIECEQQTLQHEKIEPSDVVTTC